MIGNLLLMLRDQYQNGSMISMGTLDGIYFVWKYDVEKIRLKIFINIIRQRIFISSVWNNDQQ